MFNAEGSFARKQLEKHGWTEGSGLGSSQQGISQAIRVKIKKDTTGVGHDPVKEFSHHWWDHAFNKAAASLVIENGEDGVMVKKKERTRKERSDTAKKVLYGNFIKSSMLNNGLETKVEKEGGDSDSSEDESRPKIQTLMLPDDELLQVCGGRTAHKGARHGLKLNGKLARIQEQERLLAGKNSNSHGTSPATSYSPSQNGTTDSLPSAIEDSPETKRKKKKKKRKLEDEHAESEGRVEVCEGEVMDTPEQSEDVASSVLKKKKKKKRRKEERAEDDGMEKKKRKTELVENETDVKRVAAENRASCPATEEDSSRVKKRKRKSQSSDVCTDGSELQKADDSADVKKRKKKKKTKSSEVYSDSSSGTQKQDAPEERQRKKKSGSDSADVCCDSSDSRTESKGEVCLDASVSLFNGAGCYSSVDDELKETRKKSKKKKKSKSIQ